MTVWGFVSAASLVATGGLALYVAFRGPRTASSVPFVYLMAAFAVWDLSEAVLRLSPIADPGVLVAWARLEWVAIAFTSGTFLHFVLNFATGRPLRSRPWQIPLVYAASFVVAPLAVLTDGVVTGLADTVFGTAARLGPWYPPLAIWYEAWFAFTLAAMLWAYARSASPDFRRRSRFVILVLAAATVLGSATEVFWPLYTRDPAPLGLGSIYTLGVAVVAAYSQVRLHFLEVQAVTERTPLASRFALLSGPSYLIFSRDRDPAFQAFRELVAVTPGLCTTGVHPAKVQSRYGLERTPIVWVTNLSNEEFAVPPKSLEFELFQTIARFMKGNPATVVLIDDVDLFIRTNGFEAVARLLRRVTNLGTAQGSTVIATTDPDALSEGQRTLLSGLFDEVREVAPSVSFLEPLVPDTGAVLLEGDPDAAFSIYESIAPKDRGVLVTTKNPVRVRPKLAVPTPIVWIGGSGEVVGGTERPAAIDLDAGKIATSLMKDRPHPVVYVADVEQLFLVASFPVVLDFVKALIDNVAVRNGLLLASIAPKAVRPQELASLRRRFDRVQSVG